MKDFFSYLLGLALLGASRLLAGAVGKESEGVRVLSSPLTHTPHTPRGRGTWAKHHPRVFLARGEGQPFTWLQKQLSPSGSSSTGSILCHGGDSNEFNLGTPPPQTLTLSLSQQTPSHRPPQA